MGNLANPTFPKRYALKYHRGFVLSLLCSEWEEVEHTQVKHRQKKDFVRLKTPIKTVKSRMVKENDLLVPLGSSPYGPSTCGLST